MNFRADDIQALLHYSRGNLPIDAIAVEHVDSGGYEMRLTIGKTTFAVRFPSGAVARVAHDKLAAVDLFEAPFKELQRILSDAEERGAARERTGILGKLEERTAALGYVERLVAAWRRLRRFRRWQRQLLARLHAPSGAV